MPVIYRHGHPEGKCALRMGCGEQLSMSEVLLRRTGNKAVAEKARKLPDDMQRRRGE